MFPCRRNPLIVSQHFSRLQITFQVLVPASSGWKMAAPQLSCAMQESQS